MKHYTFFFCSVYSSFVGHITNSYSTFTYVAGNAFQASNKLNCLFGEHRILAVNGVTLPCSYSALAHSIDNTIGNRIAPPINFI